MRFTQGLERAVQQRPHAVATICEDRSQTFHTLRDRVARLAGGLQAQGIGRGSRVAVLSLNSDHGLEAYLAITWLGAVIVPVNYRWSTAEIAYSLNDAACVALLFDDPHAGLIGELAQACPGLVHLIRMGRAAAGAGACAAWPALAGAQSMEALIATGPAISNADAGGDDLLGIFYTGGTTGRPKGVMLSHGNVCSSGLAMLGEGVFGEGCVGLHVAPMFHLADMLMTTCLLLCGGTHVMLAAFTPAAMLEAIARHRVTDTLVVPAMLQALVDYPQRVEHDTTSLRNILYGASPASETLLSRTLQAWPGVRLTQGYGMTESAALICVLPWQQHVPGQAPAQRLRAAGRAAMHVTVRLVDEQGRDVPQGMIGQIIVRGPNVMQGYLNQPEATADALRDGWLHTGDLGHMDDEGFVQIVDRAKDMIISGGENVYSAEVENAIASHPAVAAAAVIGVPDDRMGEAVHAVVVLREAGVLTLADLQAHCRSRIAGYKLPRSMEVWPELPMSGAGKVLKRALRDRFWQGRARAVG